MKKRILTGLLALCMLCGLAACGGPASDQPSASAGGLTSEPPAVLTPPEDCTDSGSCGDNVWWAYDENTRTLTIGGSGAMENYDNDEYATTTAPWSVYAKSIRSAVIENGVTSIGEDAFMSCPSLASVTISNSVTSIGSFAFVDCTALTSITIPSSVTTIDVEAFGYCTSLTSITIPVSVTTIEIWTFKDCDNLTDVYYTGTERQWAAIKIYSNGNDPLLNATIHYSSAG